MVMKEALNVRNIRFVRETEQGSEEFVDVTEVGLPIFLPSTGVGQGSGPLSPKVENLQVTLEKNLTNTALDAMDVFFQNINGSFSGRLEETGVGSGVFNNTEGTFMRTPLCEECHT